MKFAPHSHLTTSAYYECDDFRSCGMGSRMPVLTIDFHNTLVECDEWFGLEVRSLVSAVLDWLDAHAEGPTARIQRDQADALYRRLRLAIHLHGHELDAYRSVATVLDRLGVEIPEQAVRTAIDELMRAALEKASPVVGAETLLREIRRREIPIAVVSSAVHHEFLEWALTRFQMRESIDVVVTSASSGFYKSRPEIYWTAMSAIGQPASHGVHLGDSLRFDVGGSHLAGLRSIWFDRKQEGTDGSDYRPDRVVTDLRHATPDVLEVFNSNGFSLT